MPKRTIEIALFGKRHLCRLLTLHISDIIELSHIDTRCHDHTVLTHELPIVTAMASGYSLLQAPEKFLLTIHAAHAAYLYCAVLTDDVPQQDITTLKHLINTFPSTPLLMGLGEMSRSIVHEPAQNAAGWLEKHLLPAHHNNTTINKVIQELIGEDAISIKTIERARKGVAYPARKREKSYTTYPSRISAKEAEKAWNAHSTKANNCSFAETIKKMHDSKIANFLDELFMAVSAHDLDALYSSTQKEVDISPSEGE